MNFSDSEIVMSVLAPFYQNTEDIKSADLILINTCSIREHAEERIWNRLREMRSLKKKKQTAENWNSRMYGRTSQRAMARKRSHCRPCCGSRCVSRYIKTSRNG